MVFEGLNGTIELGEDELVITRSGLAAKMGGQSGPPQRVPLAALSDVGFKDASRMVNGWLQLGISGEELRSLNMGSAGSDPTTVTFKHKHREAFADLSDRLEAIVEQNRESGIDPATIPVELGGKAAKKTAALTAKLGGDDAREDVVQAAARMGWTLGGKRELKKLPEHLLDEETVLMIAQGSYERDQGIVVLTDRRVLFLFHGIAGQRKEDFPFRSITSVQTKSGPITGDIRIFSAGNETVIKNIVKDDVGPLADAIRDGISAAAEPQAATMPTVANDPAEQLRKLAELHDAGIVTDAEFESKKQELLERM